jgi:hypothetical protein
MQRRSAATRLDADQHRFPHRGLGWIVAHSLHSLLLEEEMIDKDRVAGSAKVVKGTDKGGGRQSRRRRQAGGGGPDGRDQRQGSERRRRPQRRDQGEIGNRNVYRNRAPRFAGLAPGTWAPVGTPAGRGFFSGSRSAASVSIHHPPSHRPVWALRTEPKWQLRQSQQRWKREDARP